MEPKIYQGNTVSQSRQGKRKISPPKKPKTKQTKQVLYIERKHDSKFLRKYFLNKPIISTFDIDITVEQ